MTKITCFLLNEVDAWPIVPSKERIKFYIYPFTTLHLPKQNRAEGNLLSLFWLQSRDGWLNNNQMGYSVYGIISSYITI